MIDEKAKQLLMEKNLKMKETGDILEVLQIEYKEDDMALVLVETRNGGRVWFSYRYVGEKWLFHGFIREDLKPK